MSDFKQAIEWLKEGKKVRRKSDKCKSYRVFYDDKDIRYLASGGNEGAFWTGNIEEFEATDWEIFEEFESISTCSKCGLINKNIKGHRAEIIALCSYKESLSEADKYNVEGQDFIDLKETKEHIQNAQRRIKDIPITDHMVEDVDKIFKEEFGDTLIKLREVK